MPGMPRKARKQTKPQRVQPAVEETLPPGPAPLAGRVIERPDGFYWMAKDDGEPHGPFATLAEAEADLLSGGESPEEPEADAGLQEAESDLGISEWIDPDTGGPAEDNVPRIEDH